MAARKIKEFIPATPEEAARYELRKELFFEPCISKEELKEFLNFFMKLDFPDCQVDEMSNSSPFTFVWEVYNTMLTNKSPYMHVAACARGTAKCLAEGTLVATPAGPVAIENIKVNDIVYDEFGKQIKVTATYDQGMQDCVNLMHHNKIMATCTTNHKWLTEHDRIAVGRQRKVSEFYNGIKIKQRILELPLGCVSEPLAYALGAFLGDGCSRDGGVHVSSVDNKIPDKVAELLGTVSKKIHENNYTWSIVSPHNVPYKFLFSEFYEKHIKGKYAHEKEAPIEIIKTWNRASLTQFVAGVIDTDGSIFMTRNQFVISVQMQSKSVIDALHYAFLALWQIDLPISVRDREHYVNGPVYELRTKNILHGVRILKEISPHLVSPQKKWKESYSDLVPRNQKPGKIGVEIVPAGQKHCYDITVDSKSSLYCLQNGMITHNTKIAATLEFLALVHFRLDVVHMSAIRQQSRAGLAYFKQYCRIDLIRPYFASERADECELVGMPENSFTSRTEAKLLTVSATLEGTNSSRPNFTVYDEVDLTPQHILSEAAMMQTPSIPNKHEPISVYLSSRKTNDGPLQKLIDKYDAGDVGTRLHKYSMIDWMEKCPPAIHGKFGVNSWVNKDTLKVYWDSLPPEENELSFIPRTVYEGCRTCRAFVGCQGRAPNQKSSSNYLKSRTFVGNVIAQTGDPGKIIAQILNWKPESAGNVFSTFSRSAHCKTPLQVWEWISGKSWGGPEGLYPSKKEVYDLCKHFGYDTTWGIDWGFRDPAVIVVIMHHAKTERTLLLHTRSATGYANHQWAQSCLENEGVVYKPDLICPDMADAASPTYFKKFPTRNKKPNLIATGVSQIRGLLFHPATQASNFAIAMYDEAAENAAQNFMKWRHKATLTGEIDINAFMDDDNCHILDSTRYALDPYVKKNKTVFSAGQKKEESFQETLNKPSQTNSEDEAVARYRKIMEAHYSEGLSKKISFEQPPSYASYSLNEHTEKKEEKPKKTNFSFRF